MYTLQTSYEGKYESYHYINNEEIIITNQITNWQNYLDEMKSYFYKNLIKQNQNNKIANKNDFCIIKNIGKGAFGRVLLIRKKSNGKYYAVKIMNKINVTKHKRLRHILNEKSILIAILFPFIINLKYFFQDRYYIYYVLPYIDGGDLGKYLNKYGKFNEKLSKFYAAQILLAIEFLHYINIIYRDLKPENILLDKQGYIKLTDFGLSKKLQDRTYTICGTPEYIAPEIILSKGYGKSADYWSYGILLYEFQIGYTPFYTKNFTKLYEKILKGKYIIPNNFNYDFKDLIKKLLEIDLTKRIGILKNGIDDIKKHRWFKNITWLSIINKMIKAPFIPSIEDIQSFEKQHKVIY